MPESPSIPFHAIRMNWLSWCGERGSVRRPYAGHVLLGTKTRVPVHAGVALDPFPGHSDLIAKRRNGRTVARADAAYVLLRRPDDAPLHIEKRPCVIDSA